MSSDGQTSAAATVAEPRWAIGRTSVAFLSILSSVAVVTIAAFVCGVAYHRLALGELGNLPHFASVGALLGLIYAQPWSRIASNDVHAMMRERADVRTIFRRWAMAFMWLGLAAFLLKMTSDFSRGWLLVLFVVGFLALIVTERVNTLLLQAAVSAGRVETNRVMLIGRDASQRRLAMAKSPHSAETVRIIGAVDIAGATDDVSAELAKALATARARGATDVVLLTDWSNRSLIEAVSSSFSILPATLRIEITGTPTTFAGIEPDALGPLKTVIIANPPLGHIDTTVKRTFDVVVAALALVLLAPVFAVIAVLIKLDSSGPVFFRQRRVGYNQREFRIWKFRSMTATDDGEQIEQAKRGDKRITRVGAWLRRYNFDELPQLINVLKGDMSLVGPRPHAVAHDLEFGQRIEEYPRRLNVKPGITGWAQINGYRGETDTDDKIRGRVEHDLYYVDNWSLGFDIWIIIKTIVSAKSYRNAY